MQMVSRRRLAEPPKMPGGIEPENSVCLVGVLLDQPALADQRGRKVGEVRLQVERQWFRVRVAGNPADAIHEHGQRGAAVKVEGRLKHIVHKRRDGRRREYTVIEAEDVQVLAPPDTCRYVPPE